MLAAVCETFLPSLEDGDDPHGLFATGAHDILTVDGEYGEVLIPFIPQFVLSTDLAAKELRVDLPIGLVPGDDAL